MKHKVAVIDRNANVIKIITRKPRSIAVFDSYIYQGELVPGYWNDYICNKTNTSAYIKDSK